MKREYTPEEQQIYDRSSPGDQALFDKFGMQCFDDFDCRPSNSYTKADLDAVMPDYLNTMIADRNGSK